MKKFTNNGEELDEEVLEIIENQDIEKDEAEEVKDLMDEYDLDEEDATELKDVL